MDNEQRLDDVEIKLGFAENMLDELNMTIYRQQQQIDALVRQLTSLQQQMAPEPGGAPRSLQSELPPHY